MGTQAIGKANNNTVLFLLKSNATQQVELLSLGWGDERPWERGCLSPPSLFYPTVSISVRKTRDLGKTNTGSSK